MGWVWGGGARGRSIGSWEVYPRGMDGLVEGGGRLCVVGEGKV